MRKTVQPLIWTRAAQFGAIVSVLLLSLILDSVGCDGSGDRVTSSTVAAEQPEPPNMITLPPASSGITAEEDAEIPPGPPGTVLVSHSAELHRIEWQGTRDDTIRGYQVYRRCPGGKWEEITFVKLRDDDERNRATYVFEDRFEAICDYTIAAVDPDGNRGPKSVDIQ